MSRTVFTPDLAVSAGLPEDRFPETIEEADMVQEILAKELQKMSLDEHEQVIFDVHGIAHVPEEDPELLREKLAEMQEELDRKLNDNDAYQQVAQLNPSYAADYRLTFLRGEKYNVPLAAEKLVQHFDVKRQLFGGGHILARDIRQSDLAPKALQILKSGFMQACNERDSSGRAVVFMWSQYYKDGITAKDLGQAILYYGMKTLRDEETLRNGMVWAFYNLNNAPVPKEYMEYVYQVEKSLAPHISAIHYCYTQETLRPYVAGMQLFFSKEDRFRLRPFMGTVEEIEFHLQTFGVPTHLSPLQKDGSWNLEWLHESLAAQRLREDKHAQLESPQLQSTESVPDSSTIKTLPQVSSADRSEALPPQNDELIIIPRRFDVILGKSAQARVHTGNRRAVHLCHMNYESYEQANKFKKTEVAERIVSIIRQSGGRFVKWEESQGGWVEELDELIARKKIGHFLRYMRSKASKASDATDEATTASKESRGSDGSGNKRVTAPTSPPDPLVKDDAELSREMPASKRVFQV